MPVSRSGNPIAVTAIVAWSERAAHGPWQRTAPGASFQRGLISVLCLAGMIHAGSGSKPRMPRLGMEQMRYMRSRPWRSRGPWFENRAGARRRGRRADELVLAVSDELLDGLAPVGFEDVEAEDVLLTSAPAWPIPSRMPAAWVAHERTSLLTPNEPGHERASQPIDQLAGAVIAAHVLSSLSDDSSASSSSSNSRQSA